MAPQIIIGGPVKILVLNYEYPPIGGGGGRVSQVLGRQLARRGHQITVLTSRIQGMERDDWTDGYRVHRVQCFRRRADRCTVPEMFAYVIASAAPAVALARRWRPDGIPYVVTAHLGDVPGGVPEQTEGLFRWLGRFTVPIWRSASAVTAVSSFTAGLSERAYGISPLVIPNGMDVSRYPTTVRRPSSPIRFVWVGRFQAQKNLLFGLQRLVDVQDLDWRLDLVGDGPDREEAEGLTRATGLSDRVTFHGWVTPDEADRVMAGADVLYVTSLSEGLSLVTVQALACGLAIVGSRIGGLTDVVEDGVNGLLCSLEDPEAFVKALRYVCEDPDRLIRMKAASRARAERFDLERVTDRYEEVFRAVVARPGA
jgi:glycosyltransferase involved in cell wall biosynthesis